MCSLRGIFAGFVVVVLATATAVGFLARVVDDEPYFLLTRAVGQRPLVAAALLVLCLLGYGAVLLWLIRLLVGRKLPAKAPPSPVGRWTARIDFVYARWYRISIVLAVAWLPLYVTSFPGQPNPDFARMIGEFLLTRSEFPPEVTPPFEAYPTSYYLLGDSERIWSNHHPFYLMLYYGKVSSLSLAWFGSYLPGVMFLSAVSLGFTLVAFGRAFYMVGQLVPNPKVRGAALLVTVLSPLIALWSMSQTKNHLFAAPFVWVLALAARLVHGASRVAWSWWVESLVAGLILAISVVFGWTVLVAMAVVAAVLVTKDRWVPLVAWAVPAILVHASVSWAIAAGHVIPSDPIESRGLALQTLALVLREDPGAISPRDRATLSRIFDLDAMAASFDPDLSDPLKSTGPFATKTDSFKYRTVRPEDWAEFDPIVLRVAAAAPGTALNALVLSSYRYLDPFDHGTNWYPPWAPDYEREVAGHQLVPLGFNEAPRQAVRTAAFTCYDNAVCRMLLSHSLKTVAVVLLCTAAIAARRRYAWLWLTPFVLQLGVVGASPLSAGGRYGLAFTYALGLVILLVAIDHGRIPADSRDS